MHSKSVKWLGDICATQTESALKGDEKAKLSSLVENTTTNNQLKSIENVITEIAATMSTSNSTLKNWMNYTETLYAVAVKGNTCVQRSREINPSARHQLARDIEQRQIESRQNNAIHFMASKRKRARMVFSKPLKCWKELCSTHETTNQSNRSPSFKCKHNPIEQYETYW